MTTESALRQALQLIAAQDQGCGGNVTEAEAWRSAQAIARAALTAQAAPSEPVAFNVSEQPFFSDACKEINSTPLTQSLLYDINLLPEQIKQAKHYAYMLSIVEHMRAALAAPPPPAAPAVAVEPQPTISDPPEGYCPRCKGSGDMWAQEGRGPDQHAVLVNCDLCDGTGAAPAQPAPQRQEDAKPDGCNRGNLCPWTDDDPSYCQRCGQRAQGSCQ
jgi:hypothetical protein